MLTDATADMAFALLISAGLDVTDPEPPRPCNPLVGLRNRIVVPHIASATVSSRNAMAEIAADNLIARLETGHPVGNATRRLCIRRWRDDTASFCLLQTLFGEARLALC